MPGFRAAPIRTHRRPLPRRMFNACLVLPAVLALMLPSVAAADITGLIRLDGSWAAYPRGYADESPAAIVAPGMRLAWTPGETATGWKLMYEGRWQRPSTGTALEMQDHGVSVERTGLPGGLAIGSRVRLLDQAGEYRAYRFRSFEGYLTWSAHPFDLTNARVTTEVEERRYPDLPEESYRVALFRAELRRSFQTRTTIGVLAEAGGKQYPAAEATRLWDEGGSPVAAHGRVRLQASQSLHSRAGLRLYYERQRILDPIPFVSASGLADSPLLDDFAAGGWETETVLKLRLPRELWLELGTGAALRDFGDVPFLSSEQSEPGTRVDRERWTFLALERTIAVRGAQQFLANLRVQWNDRTSRLDDYTYHGPIIALGVERSL